MPVGEQCWEEWTLYCSCGRPSVSSRWSYNELSSYFVSKQAHDRGYGSADEIVPLREKSGPHGHGLQ